MANKLSGADWRLLSAVLAVIFLLFATELPEECQNCEESKITVTFADKFIKKEYSGEKLLPNAVVIIQSKEKNKKDLMIHKFSMISGENKTVQLEGQEVYAYVILELKWDVEALNNLGFWEKAQLWLNENYEDYTRPTSCIAVGVILVDTTISFPK